MYSPGITSGIAQPVDLHQNTAREFGYSFLARILTAFECFNSVMGAMSEFVEPNFFLMGCQSDCSSMILE